jgi:cell division protein FtsB
LAYFGYYALYGSHGIVNWVRLTQTIELKRAELGAIQAERQGLERRVRQLRPGSIDPDLLDERARANLGYTDGDEVVILREPK